MTRVPRVSLLIVVIAIAFTAVLFAQGRAAGPLAQGRAGGAAAPNPAGSQNPNIAPTEAGTSAISGIVIDGATKAPIVGAVVYVGPPQHGPPGAPLRQLTDEKGRYLFRGLPAFPGYFVQAGKSGYANGYYGRGSSGALGGRIALVEGQWFTEGHITMWRPGAISGRIVDQAGEPVVDVFVRVLPRIIVSGKSQLAAGSVTTTDDRGMYRIASLAAGQYIVQVPSVQSSVPATAILSDPPASPTAESGIAAARAPMMDAGGGVRLQIGRYLPPLPPIAGRSAAYPPTFHPATTAVTDATVIDLKNSEERTNVDIQIRPVPTFTVSGKVEGPADEVANLTLRLLPVGLDELGYGSETATALVASDGAFSFLNVPAGAYSLEARRTVTQFELRTQGTIATRAFPRPPEPVDSRLVASGTSGVFSGTSGTSMTYRGTSDAYTARMRVTVDGRDARDVVVTLKRAAKMTGRFVWEEAPGAASASTPPLVRLLPAGGQASLGLPRTTRTAPGRGAGAAESDRFVVEGLLQGEYVMSVLGADRVKSIIWNGRDYTYRPFDASSGEDIDDVVVTFTTKSIVFTGTVRDDRGVTSDDAAVIVFPVEVDQWSNYGFSPERLKALQVTNVGAYRFQSLPAGEYFVVAVHPDLIDGWKDPSFLDKAARVATRLTLAWGENKTQDLKVMAVR